MNNFFAFDVFAFAHYFALQIKDLLPTKSAYLEDHTLVFRRNTPEGFPKADLINVKGKRVYGVLYSLTDAQKNIIKSKVLPGFRLEIKNVVLNRNVAAFTLIPEFTSSTRVVMPQHWYLKLMLAGLRKVRTPQYYLDIIEGIECAPESHNQMIFAESVMKYPTLLHKYLDSGFDMINNLKKGGKFIIKCKRHPMNRRQINIEKLDSGFSFDTTVPIKKGLQYTRDFIEDNPDMLLSKTYFVGRQWFVASKIQYGESEKVITGTIQSIQNINIVDGKYYWRLIIPVPTALNIQRTFRSYGFLYNGWSLHSDLLKINLKGVEVHYYGIKKDDSHFVVIDALADLEIRYFQEISHAVILSYALLKGKYYGGDGYFLAYTLPEMKKPKGIAYYQLRNGTHDLPEIFTTNAYFGIEKSNYKLNRYGTIPQKFIKERSKGLDPFKPEWFSRMVELNLDNSKIRDSLIQIVLNNHATLEIKIPIMFVALETITTALGTGGDKDLKPIKDNNLANELIDLLKQTAKEFADKKAFSNKEKDDFKVFLNRLSSTLNNPPNSDKLSKLFPMLGYKLQPVDKNAIEQRNAFLHGFTPKLNLTNTLEDFRKYYDLSLRLHFLLCVLLLKKVGFKGKILNYNKLHENITKIYRPDEDVYFMI